MKRCVPFLALLGLLLGPALAAACPNCQESLSGGTSKGFFWSILFLGMAPFGVTAAVTGLVIKSRRSASKKGPAPRDPSGV